jgi:Xaa-Pro aminopeptidase
MAERELTPIDWADNRRRLVEALEGDFILVLFSGPPIPKSADEVYPFSPNRNFLYVTGMDRASQCLVVSRRGSQVEEAVFIEPVDAHTELWNGKMMTEDEARSRSGVATVLSVNHLHGYLNSRLASGRWQRLYLDLERRSWDQAASYEQQFARSAGRRYPGVRIANVYPELARLRRIKSAAEIERVREAVRHTHRGFTAIVQNTRPGRMEYELEAEFQYTLRLGGVQPGYASIVGAGINATCMHYTTLTSPIRADEMVLVDAAAEFQYYKADITRTFPASGRFTDRQRAVYEIVREASQATIAQIRPGVPHIHLNQTTRRILAQGLKSLHLIRDEQELDRYYYYNVSHYLGLDTHDVGEYGELEPGMVLTVEPGLYIASEALGVRIEDDIAVTEAGADVLSRDIPTEPAAVVAWMANGQ